jgi:hypothetical protein
MIIEPRGKRAYGQVQNLLESMGGSAEFLKGGHGGGGSWVLKLGKYTSPPLRLVRVEDAPHGPLDKLYEPDPDKPNPRLVGDYPDDVEAHLVEDAPERLVAWLVKGKEY